MLGLKELDILVLENLDDKDLVSYCKTNKAANRVCQDQSFWYNRLRLKFPQIDLEIMAEVKSGNWSDIYIQMVQFVRSISQNKDIRRNKDEIISFRNKEEALVRASQYGHLDIVKYLVEEGAYIHAWEDYSLIMAGENGHLEVVKYLVEKGANIGYDLSTGYDSSTGDDSSIGYDSSLILASKNGHLDIVKYLVEKGANIHAGNDEALRLASQKGHKDVVDYLKSL